MRLTDIDMSLIVKNVDDSDSNSGSVANQTECSCCDNDVNNDNNEFGNDETSDSDRESIIDKNAKYNLKVNFQEKV